MEIPNFPLYLPHFINAIKLCKFNKKIAYNTYRKKEKLCTIYIDDLK
jgi:hypothetical protein